MNNVEENMENLIKSIRDLANEYSNKLNLKIKDRVKEMKTDDKSHYLIYRVLGINDAEGDKIDIYQNKGRFLYKYAGSFLEEATVMCLKYKHPNGEKVKIKNTEGQKPKTFEIDFLCGTNAFEIKWKDATTDGDHITKEHTRVKAVQKRGYKPIRLMFYTPQREQAQRIQDTLKTVYKGVKGQYYAGENAWNFLKKYTGIDLKKILETIANEKVSNA